MTNHFDAIVIGTGGVGSAALYHLARRGKKVLGLDPHPPGHSHGSSHGETRVIRQAYFEHPDYVPLLLRAYELWRDLEQQAGEQLLFEIGLLQVGPPDGMVLQGVLKAAELHGLNVESLSATQVAARYPQFTIAAHQAGVFEPTGGYLLVEKCVLAHLNAARIVGAEWKQQRVTGFTYRDAVHHVSTTDGDYTADYVVVTAGPWTEQLLPGSAGALTILQKQQNWFPVPAIDPANPDSAKPGEHSAYDSSEFPIFLFETNDGIFYGFPTLNGVSLKVSEHSGGIPIESPESAIKDSNETDVERTTTFLKSHLPGIQGEPVHQAQCFYTMSADEHFIVGKHADSKGLLLAAGLSGHGFKFTSVLGEALAELVIDGKSRLSIDFLSPARF